MKSLQKMKILMLQNQMLKTVQFNKIKITHKFQIKIQVKSLVKVNTAANKLIKVIYQVKIKRKTLQKVKNLSYLKIIKML